MTKCSVKSCMNEIKTTKKNDGISYFHFPNEPTLRTAWLKALGREHWEPKEKIAICSEHFLQDDLYETKSGLRNVRTGAVPIVLQDSSKCVFSESASLEVCRICLVMDVKLFPIRKYKLQQAYEHLTGLRLCEEDKLPQKLCTECAYKLLSCSKFRNKSLRANSLMLEIIRKQDNLTIENIRTIDRALNNLASTLTSNHYEPDYYESHIEYNEADRQMDNLKEAIQMHEVIIDVKIKNEKNDDEVKNESSDDEIKNENNDNVIKNENNDNVIKNENNDDNDDEVGNENDDEIKNENNDDVIRNEYNNDEVKNENNDDVITSELKDDEMKNGNNGTPEISDEHEGQKIRIDVELVISDKGASLDNSLQKKETTTKRKVGRRKKPFLGDFLNEALFTITELTFEEQIAEIEKRKETSNYKNAAFKCTDCYKSFMHEKAYNTHIIRHTDRCGEFKCKICKSCYKNCYALRNHIASHHAQRFNCNQCKFITTHRHIARHHEKWHKGIKYQCPHCQEEFDNYSTYMTHVRIKHPSDFVCELCGFSFVSKKGIISHKNLKHKLDNSQVPEDGPYCEVCDVRFVSEEAHARHLKLSSRHCSDKDPNPGHTTARKNRIRNDPQSLNKNEAVKRKIEVGPVTCEQCGIQLSDMRLYTHHFRRMHPHKNRTKFSAPRESIVCEHCGRVFQCMTKLKEHMWVHTGEKQFKCDYCSKSFTQKITLMTHMRVHSASPPTYECSICGKHFSYKGNRLRHMLTHTGLKPFKCETCGKCFASTGEQRAHVEHVHLKKPWPKRIRASRTQPTPEYILPM